MDNEWIKSVVILTLLSLALSGFLYFMIRNLKECRRDKKKAEEMLTWPTTTASARAWKLKEGAGFRGRYPHYTPEVTYSYHFDGKEYLTTEHYFQSMKFPGSIVQEKVRTASTPALAKKLARQHKSEVRKDWFDISIKVMETALKAKFSIPELKEKLLDTGDLELQEGNTWNDTFWGVDLKSGKGENHLGKLLMKIRDEFKIRK